MRKIAAGALAIPFLAFILISAGLRRTGSVKLYLLPLMVGLLVTGLLVGLPAKQVSGTGTPTFASLTPLADAHPADQNMGLDAPFKVQFTKPMNQGAVEAAVTITPQVSVEFRWDATAQTLALMPKPHWTPNTEYRVSISGAATDQQGIGLAAPIDTVFQSGGPTTGVITATEVVGNLVSPGTTFQITFSRPVKLATVVAELGIYPSVPVTIEGSDPADLTSQIFTITPVNSLGANKTYTLSFFSGAPDASGSPLDPVPSLTVTTMASPEVVRFRPQPNTVTYDPNQPVSVRFTVPMDHKSTQAAFNVKVNGRTVTGRFDWVEGDTVLVLAPRYSFPIGSTVTARVSTSAKAQDGTHLGSAASTSFTVAKPKSKVVPFTGGVASGTRPWYSSEVYYFNLMNCTRTGNWVTSQGYCSTETHHTMPAQDPLTLDAGISNKVARPYAKYMADNRLLDHYLNLRGTNPHLRLSRQGWTGPSWGENIASPPTVGKAGMIRIELFYQNEAPCRCEHYYNIMSRYLDRAGVGVWFSKSVRVAIDFYG